MNERLAIAGSGAIACGLATTAAGRNGDASRRRGSPGFGGPVLLLARSQESAERARQTLERTLERIGAEVDRAGGFHNIQVVTDRDALADASFVVEAVVEDHDVKAGLLAELHGLLAPEAILASTTSSLSIERLAAESGRPERFVGLHVFNPVPRMQLVELVFPGAVTEDTRARARALCEALGKTAVEVPDVPGFVVNRLLFPYLFSAVRLIEETGMDPGDVDKCMKLGAGHPMGPLALLDLVGLDVAAAIGETIGEHVPARVSELIAAGALGRKSGHGFHNYSR